MYNIAKTIQKERSLILATITIFQAFLVLSALVEFTEDQFNSEVLIYKSLSLILLSIIGEGIRMVLVMADFFDKVKEDIEVLKDKYPSVPASGITVSLSDKEMDKIKLLQVMQGNKTKSTLN